ncbi:MAG TPA: hypothetical protein PLC80_01730 [Draconibacterium sp.]|nr:hypothetical protein [Draconibacterium sp.]
MGLIVRNGWYYFYKRVPEYLKEYDNRTFIRISLKTKDKSEAQKKAVVYEEQHKKFWQSLIKQGKKAKESDIKKLSAIAQAYGYAYKDISDIIDNSSIEEIADRLNIVAQNLQKKEVEQALLGTVEQNSILLSSCLDTFWEHCADRFANKSEHQIRKYKSPRTLHFNEFIEVIGNKDLNSIDRKDILTFHRWLLERISQGILADTANKKMQHVRDVLRTVANAYDIPFEDEILFSRTRFKLSHNSRPPFEAFYVQDKLLPGLEGLNEEAQMLVYAMADTGAREAELIGLTKDDIFLDTEIPFIWIRPKEKRELKTRHSERQIPLVGTALLAFQKSPHGFNRYKEADSASTLINKYFRNNNLCPTPKHSLYSLRHTFKDRLRDVQAPEEVIDQLMGHRIAKPRYGRGHLLKTSHEWLKKIAFTPPI